MESVLGGLRAVVGTGGRRLAVGSPEISDACLVVSEGRLVRMLGENLRPSTSLSRCLSSLPYAGARHRDPGSFRGPSGLLSPYGIGRKFAPMDEWLLAHGLSCTELRTDCSWRSEQWGAGPEGAGFHLSDSPQLRLLQGHETFFLVGEIVRKGDDGSSSCRMQRGCSDGAWLPYFRKGLNGGISQGPSPQGPSLRGHPSGAVPSGAVPSGPSPQGPSPRGHPSGGNPSGAIFYVGAIPQGPSFGSIHCRRAPDTPLFIFAYS